MEKRKRWGASPAVSFMGRGDKAAHARTCTCPASMHLWLRQTLQSPRLQRQPQRTQAGVSRTRPPPLAAPGGTGGGHRAGVCAGSAAGAVSCRWCRRSGRQLQHQGVRGDWARGEGLRRALRWPLLGWAAAALATAGTAAAEASPGATAAECPTATASPGVGGAAEAEGTGG